MDQDLFWCLQRKRIDGLDSFLVVGKLESIDGQDLLLELGK
jgi:hypothetical protein